MSKMQHVWQSHIIKHVLYHVMVFYSAIVVRPKDLWHAIKKF